MLSLAMSIVACSGPHVLSVPSWLHGPFAPSMPVTSASVSERTEMVRVHRLWYGSSYTPLNMADAADGDGDGGDDDGECVSVCALASAEERETGEERTKVEAAAAAEAIDTGKKKALDWRPRV